MKIDQIYFINPGKCERTSCNKLSGTRTLEQMPHFYMSLVSLGGHELEEWHETTINFTI